MRRRRSMRPLYLANLLSEHSSIMSLSVPYCRLSAQSEAAGGIPRQSTTSKHKLCYRPGVIPEIKIWRVAVLIAIRYAGEAKLNSLRHDAELTVEGDHNGATICRRVTMAIE